MALLSWTSKNWTSLRWLEHMHCLACPFLSKNTPCEVILLSLQRSDLVSNQRYSLISTPCLPCLAKCTSLPQDCSVTWPSWLLDALSHTLGRWLSNTLAVTVLQRNPAQAEHGQRGKASTWNICVCLILLTPYKSQCPKKTMSPKIHQNSMPCSACWTRGWSYLLVDGKHHFHFQVSHKQCSLSWYFPLFLRFRVPSSKQTLMCTPAKLQ